MKINNIRNNPKSEVVVVNRKVNFGAVPKKLPEKPILPEAVIKRFGLNMEARVGYTGERTIAPAPIEQNARTGNFFERLQIDWNTHVDKYNRVG